MGLPFLAPRLDARLAAILFVIVVFVVGEMLWVPTSQAVVAELAPGGHPRRLHGCVRERAGDRVRARAADRPPDAQQLRRRGDVGDVRRHRRRRRACSAASRWPGSTGSARRRAGLLYWRREARGAGVRSSARTRRARRRRASAASCRPRRGPPLEPAARRPLPLRLRNFRPGGGGLPRVARRAAAVHGPAARDRGHDGRPRAGARGRAASARGGGARPERVRGRVADEVVARWSFDEVNDLIDAAQPLVPRRVAAADGSAARATTRSSTGATTVCGRSTPRGRSRGSRRRRLSTSGRAQPRRAARRGDERERAEAAAERGRGPGRRSAWASAPPTAGPVSAPTAHAVFVTPKPMPWGRPAALGPVGDERHPRRVEAAEGHRGGHDEDRDDERLGREARARRRRRSTPTSATRTGRGDRGGRRSGRRSG